MFKAKIMLQLSHNFEHNTLRYKSCVNVDKVRMHLARIHIILISITKQLNSHSSYVARARTHAQPKPAHLTRERLLH